MKLILESELFYCDNRECLHNDKKGNCELEEIIGELEEASFDADMDGYGNKVEGSPYELSVWGGKCKSFKELGK